MKTVPDPWSNSDSFNFNGSVNECFEDSFVSSKLEAKKFTKLPDSKQYLERLHCIARLITDGQNIESTEEQELAANPLIRHIAPHLHALTASELVHLLKADVLQSIVDERNNQSLESEDRESELTDNQSDIRIQDSNRL